MSEKTTKARKPKATAPKKKTAPKPPGSHAPVPPGTEPPIPPESSQELPPEAIPVDPGESLRLKAMSLQAAATKALSFANLTGTFLAHRVPDFNSPLASSVRGKAQALREALDEFLGA